MGFRHLISGAFIRLLLWAALKYVYNAVVL
jgi:hypothetical protein